MDDGFVQSISCSLQDNISLIGETEEITSIIQVTNQLIENVISLNNASLKTELAITDNRLHYNIYIVYLNYTIKLMSWSFSYKGYPVWINVNSTGKSLSNKEEIQSFLIDQFEKINFKAVLKCIWTLDSKSKGTITHDKSSNSNR